MSIARTFDPSTLVALPRMSAAGAVTLGHQLIQAATGATPAALQPARADLVDAHKALNAAFVAQNPPPDADDPGARDVDRNCDAAWGGLHSMLLGAQRLPGAPAINTAATTLLGALFGSGLDFTQFKYVNQWAESDARLKRVAEQNLEPAFQALGLGYALQAVRQAHAAYSAMLGVSQKRPVPTVPPSLAEPLNAFANALRAYVLKVSAHVDRRDPATQKLADALLAPLRVWETGASRAGATDEPAPAPAGTPG
jgi:hypothetical protein